MSLTDLINYSRVCKDTNRAVSAYARTAYQLHRCLLPFMDRTDADRLRLLMRSTGAIISGSVALQFFTRETMYPCDLDLYTDRFRAPDIFAFVLGLGYVYLPREGQHPVLKHALTRADNEEVVRDTLIYDKESLLDAFSFVRPCSPNTIIQVMVAAHSPIDAVLDFHSTIVMNFITHRAAYALYPSNTFGAKIGICFEDDTINGAASKYRARGWNVRCAFEDRALTELGPEIMCTERYVGDKYTWTVNLPDEEEDALDSVLFNSWSLRWAEAGRLRLRPKMIRHFYADYHNLWMTRIFATKDLKNGFADRITSIRADKITRTDVDVLQAVVRTGAASLFAGMPPCATDTRFIANVKKTYLVTLGVPQFALKSSGPTDLLPCAREEKDPAAYDTDDDIVCTGMSFGRSLDNDKNSVNANRSIAIWKVNGKPANSTRSTGFGFEAHIVIPGESLSRVPKRRRIHM
ncbi:hypothetical protein FB107DRAFT_279706 [Schizophyllum commune]